MRAWTLLCILSLAAGCDGGATDGDDTGDSGDTGADSGDTGADSGSDDCVLEGTACILTGRYTTDLHLTADKIWLLRSGVLIGDDTNRTTLTIDPGTTVYGESATNGFLVITRGSRIVAEGTASAPIVFTPDQPEGSRSRGDWGGLILNGRAPINACLDGSADCEAEGEGGTGLYGGSDPDDDSGVLTYVRIEFGGTEISPDNEINGLSLAGVGHGTVIDYVQIHMNFDDGVEFFGGTADVKHLVVTGAGDDSIDWDLGWQGRLQFAMVQQYADAGNNGFEADGNEGDHSATPMSRPVISNVTLIGSPDRAEDNFGALLRRGTGGELHNVAIDGYTAACLAIRDDATYGHYDTGDLAFAHARFACDTSFEQGDDDVMTEDEVFAGGTDNQVVADLGLTNATSTSAPDFRPTGSSPLLSGGQAPSDSFFTAASYIGAFDGTTDWTSGWTTHAAN